MPSKYIISDHQAPHFITYATINWIDALSRPIYKDIIVDSLSYCIENKGLILYAWVIMDNHVHLIASADNRSNLSDILRDSKKYTSKQIIASIGSNSLESRKDWMLWFFARAGKRNNNNKSYQFWQQDNRPIELSTNKMIDQRLSYLHQNPVKAGIVFEAEYYVYSSAIDYAGGAGMLPLVFIH